MSIDTATNSGHTLKIDCTQTERNRRSWLQLKKIENSGIKEN